MWTLISVRMEAGRTILEGRVELFRSGIWGTICGASFGDEEADVICRDMGYESGVALDRRDVHPGEGVIWMQPNCTGVETSLIECDFECWGCNDCHYSHWYDAGVRCSKYKHPTLCNWSETV